MVADSGTGTKPKDVYKQQAAAGEVVILVKDASRLQGRGPSYLLTDAIA